MEVDQPVEISSSWTLFLVFSALYFLPDVITGLIIPLCPQFARDVELSNGPFAYLLFKWNTEMTLTGRGLYTSSAQIFQYGIFWAFVISTKLVYEYRFTISPLVKPSKEVRERERRQGREGDNICWKFVFLFTVLGLLLSLKRSDGRLKNKNERKKERKFSDH